MLMLINHIELDTFANESDIMWRGFVASAIAAVSLQWVNPFGTAKLVLFQVNTTRQYQICGIVTCFLQVTFVSDTWRAFELASTKRNSSVFLLTCSNRFLG